MSFYDEEAVYQDADVEQAEFERAGNAIARARRAGRCTHQSSVGYIDPPVYPEQVGLEPGQSRCTEGCNVVFNSDDDWADAREEAIS